MILNFCFLCAREAYKTGYRRSDHGQQTRFQQHHHLGKQVSACRSVRLIFGKPRNRRLLLHRFETAAGSAHLVDSQNPIAITGKPANANNASYNCTSSAPGRMIRQAAMKVRPTATRLIVDNGRRNSEHWYVGIAPRPRDSTTRDPAPLRRHS